MTKVNPNNKNDTKSDVFSWDIFKSEMPKYFSDFNNWYFSILFQKCTKKKKKNRTCANMTVFVLI